MRSPAGIARRPWAVRPRQVRNAILLFGSLCDISLKSFVFAGFAADANAPAKTYWQNFRKAVLSPEPASKQDPQQAGKNPEEVGFLFSDCRTTTGTFSPG
jgi:hypothetical protein